MATQYGRVASLVVADEASGLDLSSLHVKFEVKQWSLQTPGSCSVRVYNVASNTAKKIQTEFTKLILGAGYKDGGATTIFAGTIVQVRGGRENPVDTYLDITAADGDEAHNFSVVNTSLAAGRSYADRVNALVQAMGAQGVTPGYIAPLPDGTLPRGKVMFGMARDHLRDLSFATDMDWSVQQGQFQLIPKAGYLPGQAVVLTPATGLIGLPEVTADGIKVRCLLNPLVKAGGLIQLDSATLQQAQLDISYQGSAQNAFLPQVLDGVGSYRVLVAEHSGDTRGNTWYTDIICLAPGQVTQGLVNRGYA